jgi:capsular polysaccharide transport system permease protein
MADSVSLPAQKPRRRRLRGARTIFALILREMATTYGRSAVGYMWAIIEPVAALTLLTLVFSLLLRSPPLGSNFPLFYASGYLIFSAYISVTNKVATSVQFSRQLLEFPAVTVLDAILARFILNMLTQIMVICIVLTGIIVIYDLKLILDLKDILISLGMTAAFVLGLGTFNCYLFLAFPSYQQVWSIANRPMFILSCIFFLFDSVPQPYRDFLWYNPLIHMVGKMRAGIYATYQAEYVSIAYVMGLSLLLFAVGLFLLRHHVRNALNA